jgi:S-methylmethionine-dependent homocysteine/selenocysteine methylase
MSFACKDEEHLNSGEKFSDVFGIIDGVDCDEKDCSVISVGINCTGP